MTATIAAATATITGATANGIVSIASTTGFYKGAVVWVATTRNKLDFKTLTGAFTVGQVVTGGSSGAVGTISTIALVTATSGTLTLTSITGTFQDAEAITDPITGAAIAVGNLYAVSQKALIVSILTSTTLSVRFDGAHGQEGGGGTDATPYNPGTISQSAQPIPEDSNLSFSDLFTYNGSTLTALVPLVSTGSEPTGNVTLHVETTGNDTTGDGSVGAPFATAQAAIASLGTSKRLRYLSTILMGIGNFPGISLSGFTVDPTDFTAQAGILLKGTLITATLATGSATGTFSSVTAGSASSATFCVCVDSGQTWTVNDLKGRPVEILTGTNAGQITYIISNDATSFTIPQAAAFGAAAGTYAIRAPGTIITGSVSSGVSIPAVGASAGASPTYGINFVNCTSLSSAISFRFECLKIANSGSGSVNIENCPAWAFQHCETSTATNGFIVSGPANVSGVIQQCAIRNSSVAINATTMVNSLRVVSCLLYGNTFGITVQTPTSGLSILQSRIESTGTGISCSIGAILSPSGTQISGATTGIATFTTAAGALVTTPVTVTGSSLSVSNCTTGISLNGPHTLSITTLVGTGNTTGIVLGRGAKVQIGSGSSITGTTEVTIDGTNTTLSAMRAVTPKLITTTYGTGFFE